MTTNTNVSVTIGPSDVVVLDEVVSVELEVIVDEEVIVEDEVLVVLVVSELTELVLLEEELVDVVSELLELDEV